MLHVDPYQRASYTPGRFGLAWLWPVLMMVPVSLLRCMPGNTAPACVLHGPAEVRHQHARSRQCPADMVAAALLSLTRAMQHAHTRCMAAEVQAGLFRPAFADKAGLTQSTSSTSPRLAALLKGLCACRRQDCRLHRCCPLHFLHALLCGSLCMATITSAMPGCVRLLLQWVVELLVLVQAA